MTFKIFSPLEQFEILPIIPIQLGSLDFSITNEVVILLVIFFLLTSLFYFSVKESDLDRHDNVWIFGLQDDISEIMEVHVIGVNPEWLIINMKGTEEDPRFSVNFFAGSQAMAQASIMGFDEVCLVGFDSIWNHQEDTYQNIYAGTNAYKREKETSRLRVGTDDPNSLLGTQEAQIKKVIDRFEDVDYTIYNDGIKKPLTYDSFI